MKTKTLLLALALGLAAGHASAAGKAVKPEKAVVVVEAVQMPAWVEHANGGRDALVVGATLHNKDRVVTGEGSRAALRMSDGSLVRLGANGNLALDDLAQRRFNAKDVVTATLDVLAGAFRFTTQALPKQRVERDVKVRVVTITLGLRGTDLWARPEAERDVVCLLEGKIDVTRGEQAFTMDQAMSFYIAPKGKPGEPVAAVSKEQLDKWIAETDVATGKGALRAGGKWRLYLGDASDQDGALSLYDQLRNAGYAAQIRPVSTEAGTTYRVRISNFATREEAAAFGEKLKGKFGITAPQVSR